MNIYIIILAHNEQDNIHHALDSLVNQTLLPKHLVVVNDNSTDNTASVISKYTSLYPWITTINKVSSDKHLPGAKIINAFYSGLETLNNNYDIICKFDADLIFPSHYLETLVSHFKNNKSLGMAAGFCYIKKNSKWVLEDLTRNDHIRGGLKAYRKDCFIQIGKLKQSMGWDTVDELLAQYYGWQLKTDSSLKVKHLKPTGKNYNKASKHMQGEALYKMRYGFWLSFLSAAKLAVKKKKLYLFIDYMVGYFRAAIKQVPYLVSPKQGKFIRKLRWMNIIKKLKQTLYNMLYSYPFCFCFVIFNNAMS